MRYRIGKYMRINPQTFFKFCAEHTQLLRAISEHGGEISYAETMQLIRAKLSDVSNLPQNTWRRLCELQILIPAEPGSEFFLMAEPVARLLTYLSNDANPATPEMIRGYVSSLETADKQLTGALAKEDIEGIKLAFDEISQTLRRIYADLNETQQAILAEVARYKTERARVSVRDKYRRILHWMKRYVEPMIDIVRADGPLRATFDETEQLIHRAREESVYYDHPTLVRNLRFLRFLGDHALRVFTQCRREIQPLYESLRRSSSIAEGAAHALEQLRADGLPKWGTENLIGIAVWRFQNVPSDAAIALVLRNVLGHPPEPPPVIELAGEQHDPAALRRLRWLDSLPARVREFLPVPDLLGWLVEQYPDRDTSEMLAGLSELVFHDELHADFIDRQPRAYPATDGEITAVLISLSLA